MFRLTLFLVIFFTVTISYTQTYLTEKGSVYFIAKAEKENIEAHNHTTHVEISFDTKHIDARLLIKNFDFKNETGKTVFLNETMETKTFSTAYFSGNFAHIKENKYLITGEIELHGMKSQLKFPAEISFINDKCVAKATFIIHYTDFEISLPKKLTKSISKEILVSMEFQLDKTKEDHIQLTDTTSPTVDSTTINSYLTTTNSKNIDTTLLNNDSTKNLLIINKPTDTTNHKTEQKTDIKEIHNQPNHHNEQHQNDSVPVKNQIIAPKEVE